MTFSCLRGVLPVLLILLAGCATPVVETEQSGPLTWPSNDNDVLPPADSRYDIPEPVPAGTRVTLRAPRLELALDTSPETRTIDEPRLYTDSNGLPLVELPEAPEDAITRGETVLERLEWDVERVSNRESRIEIDGSAWLDRRTDQLFPSRPVIYIYFYALGSGTQVHLEREDKDQPFPVSAQREILETLFAELEAGK